MRFNYTLLAAVLIASQANAQKVDLDKFHFPVSYQELPQVYVPLAQRTFNTYASLAPTLLNATGEKYVLNNVNIAGWQWAENDATVKIDVNLNDFGIRSSNTQTRTVEEKDKSGRVVKSTNYYSVRTIYFANGGAIFTGPESLTSNSKSKKEDKPEKTNKFLSAAANATENTAPGQSTEKVLLNNSLTHQTQESMSSYDADRNYRSNKENYYNQKAKEYVDGAINSVNMAVNKKYGYVTTTKNDFLWIIDSKSHPEYQTQHDAIEAIKVLFTNMSATGSNEALEKGLAPVIEYLNSLKTKYTDSDKRERKIRYSAFYNLAKIYYYLDNADKCIAEANGLINNDFDTDDGKYLIGLAEELKADMARVKTDTRHNAHLK